LKEEKGISSKVVDRDLDREVGETVGETDIFMR
jgi:hypothetical protein